MTDISPEATGRREAARVNGRFGVQRKTAPEITIDVEGVMDHSISQTLERKSAENTTASQLAPGMEVLTETNTPDGPFGYALRRDRDLRRRWRAAGMPTSLTVLSRRSAPEDGHTDDEVTFALNGQPLVLTFHRHRSFRFAN